VRLFLLAQPVARRSLDAALPRTGTGTLVQLGLVAEGPGAQVAALLDLRPHAVAGQDGPGWWVVSDLGETATGAPLPEQHVLGIGSASLTLAAATVRRPAARVLDLGTGSGVQALHATSHARQVVATDISARALRLAALTLRINGLQNRVELRQGDLLEPVAGERFDLVVSNPPFVITPRRADVPAMQYRDGGLAGDEVVRRLVIGLGEHLEPGGIAQLLGNWEIPAGRSWDERVEQWVQESGLDAWVVQREVLDPAEYAELWIRDGGVSAGPRYETLYAAWLDDLAARDVEAVGLGMILLRRPGPGTRALRRLEDVRGATAGALGAHLDRCLAGHDALAGDDAGLLRQRFAVAADVTEERHHRPGQDDPEVIVLRQGGGLGRTARVGTAVAAVVGACDGELELGQLAGAVAALLEQPIQDVVGQLLPTVRNLVLDGVLGPLAR